MKSRLSIAVLAPCVFRRDGVGNAVHGLFNSLRDQAAVLDVYHEHKDADLPDWVGNHFVSIHDLLQARLRRDAFFKHDLYFFQFVFHYRLLEVMPSIERGRVLAHYHGFTPPRLLDPRDPYRKASEDAISHQHGLLDFADGVIVHSLYMKKELQSIHPYPDDRIHVVPITAGESFKPRTRKPRLRFDFSPLLVYVGRLAGNKRVDVLLRSLSILVRDYPRCGLLLVGEHSREVTDIYRKRLAGLISSLDLADSVRFIDGVDDSALAIYYNAADLFVTASEHEGFCIPVAEAAACGLPSVVAGGSATVETVGEAGAVCRPGDPEAMAAAIKNIIDSPRLLSELKEKALSQAQRFSRTEVSLRMEEIITNVNRQKRKQRPTCSPVLNLLGAGADASAVYYDSYRKTLAGPLVRWFRRKATLPLEVSCLRPMAERQAKINRMILQEFEKLEKETARLESKLEKGLHKTGRTRSDQ